MKGLDCTNYYLSFVFFPLVKQMFGCKFCFFMWLCTLKFFPALPYSSCSHHYLCQNVWFRFISLHDTVKYLDGVETLLKGTWVENASWSENVEHAEISLGFFTWSSLQWLFPHLWGFGENVQPFIPCPRFCCVFFLMEISLRTLIPLFMPGSVHWFSELRQPWPNVPWQAACELVSRWVPTLCLDSGIVSPLCVWPRVHECWGVTCYLHFWQNDRGLLHATAVIRGWSGHQIRVSTQTLLWRRKFSCCFCQDSNSKPFDHKSSALTSKLSWLTHTQEHPKVRKEC